MRVLFISSPNIIAADLARLIEQEGNEVKLYIDDKKRKLNLNNMVGKTDDWKKELDWVGNDGLIVFDDCGYGKIQDELREKGYSVFGGNKESDKLELDREYAQKVFKNYGLQTLRTVSFNDIDECAKFIKANKENWVIKQNNHKLNINHVSLLEDNQDILDILKFCKEKYSHDIGTITLQEKMTGVEVGVGRYFNGDNWVGPVEINFEHKNLFNGNIGPMTTEMGTLAWYEDDKKSILFKKTIANLKPYLKKINFRGDFEVNFIANDKGIFPIEPTPRFGSPIIYLQNEIHLSGWAELLKAVADGEKFDLKWKRGYGIVVLLAVPPFPYVSDLEKISPKGMGVYFDKMKDEEYKHIYFEGVAKRGSRNMPKYYISDGEGYVAYVAGVGRTVKNIRKKVYGIISNIHTPKMLYRTDIGQNFIKRDKKLLKKWGWLK